MTTLAHSPLQVYLRPEQVEALRGLAKKHHTSMAELVRQGVDRLLADIPPQDDPLWTLVGLGNSGLGDLASDHDRYLADQEIRGNGRTT